MEQKPTAAPDERGSQILQRMVMAAMKLLYTNPQTTQQIAETIKSSDDKAGAVVSVTRPIVEQVRGSLQGLNPATADTVAPMVAALAAEIGVKSGGMPDDPKILAQAISLLRQSAERAPQKQPAPQAEAPPAPPATAGLVAQAMGG